MPRPSLSSHEIPRVVVIDDDEFEREFVVDLLGKAGFKVSSLPSMIGVSMAWGVSRRRKRRPRFRA
jgi:hypothetical protein